MTNEQTAGDPGPSETAPAVRKRRRRGYHRHGFYALKITLNQLGPRVLDQRTALGKALATWKADLERDLGGNPSTAQAALVALVCRQKVLLESIDAWLLTQPTLVNKRRRTLLPVVRERQQLADSLAKYLGMLGLERRAELVPSLDAYLAARKSPPVTATQADNGGETQE